LSKIGFKCSKGGGSKRANNIYLKREPSWGKKKAEGANLFKKNPGSPNRAFAMAIAKGEKI